MSWQERSPHSQNQSQNREAASLETERRLVLLEQAVKHIHQLITWKDQTTAKAMAGLERRISDLQADQKEIYRYAWNIVWAVASSAALLVFNVIWSSLKLPV
jgi:hypothetical protein